MRAAVFVSLIYACSAVPAIFLQDTPEVIAEKRRFQQLYNAAAAAAAAAPDIHIFPQHKQSNRVHSHVTHQVHTPSNSHHRFASPPQHFQTHNHIQTNPKWTGPLAATVPAGLPGSVSQVQNTPEVNAAIADFMRAFNAAVVATKPAAASHRQSFGHQSSHNTFSHQPQRHFSQQPQRPVANPHHNAQPRWTGPLAATVPAGLPGSTHQVADTAEVAQARNAFHQAFNQQLARVAG